REAHTVHVRKPPVHDVFIHIAHGHGLHVRHSCVFLNVLKALSAKPADTDPDTIVRAKNPLGLGNETNSREGRCTATLFKYSLCDAFRFVLTFSWHCLHPL